MQSELIAVYLLYLWEWFVHRIAQMDEGLKGSCRSGVPQHDRLQLPATLLRIR